MEKRCKVLRLSPEAITQLLVTEVGELVAVKSGLPKDVKVLRSNYDTESDRLILVLWSSTWPIVPANEILPTVQIEFQRKAELNPVWKPNEPKTAAPKTSHPVRDKCATMVDLITRRALGIIPDDTTFIGVSVGCAEDSEFVSGQFKVRARVELDVIRI